MSNMNTAEKIKAHIKAKIESGEHILWMPYLVGISGKSGAGKSEAATFLSNIHKYNTCSFAASMKNAASYLFDLSVLHDKSEPIPGFEVITRGTLPIPRYGNLPQSLWPSLLCLG